MLVAAILAASLTLPSTTGAAASMHHDVTRQALAHAVAVSAAAAGSPIVGAQAAKPQTNKDPKWDGALKGALIGGAAGLLVGLKAEDKHGSASFGFYVVPTATLIGAGIGAVTGLIIDLARK
jgi:hypothetical protein